MNTPLLFIAALILGQASALPTEPEGCQVCRDSVKKLMDYALDTVVSQQYLLTEEVCKNGDFEVGGCVTGVTVWWPEIANIVFGSPKAVEGVCSSINPECSAKKFPILRQWDCATCKADLGAVKDAFTSAEGLDIITSTLKGDVFCGKNAGNDEQFVACQNYIDAFMPPAIKVLAGRLVSGGTEICQTVYEIC